MKFAYIQSDKVVKIVEADSIEELLPLDFQYANLVELTGFTPEPQVGWWFQNNKFRDPTLVDGASQSVKNTKITKLSLLNRFTLEELYAYETALESSILLKVLDKKLFASMYIDLASEETVFGIQALASNGIISASRANEILQTDALDSELYKG